MSVGDVRMPSDVRTRKPELTAVAKKQRVQLLHLKRITNTIAHNAPFADLFALDFDAANSPPLDADDALWLDKNGLSNGHYFDESSLAFPTFPATDKVTRTLKSATNENLENASAPEHVGIPTPAVATPQQTSVDNVSMGQATSSSRDDASGTADVPSTQDKTVQLVQPTATEDVQEELRERKEAEDQGRRRSESDKSLRNAHLQVNTVEASSPSSTVGAHSATTPMPPQDSADTSPNTEPDVEVPPPKALQPSPEEQRAQEEHDRTLEVQKEIARKQALGDEATPDEQLKWEAQAADARRAEEQAAKQDADRSKPSEEDMEDVAMADRGVEDVGEGVVPQQVATPATTQDENATIPTQDSKVAHDDEDNITVTHRPSDATRPTLPLENDSVRAVTPREVPTARHTNEAGRTPRLMRALPTRAAQMSSALVHELAQTSSALVHELAPLKGAAQDPDRDYLEPLFRIQAHDTPNARTKPLLNLVKDAAKYLSTEDHYTTLHERLDYKILRRIYQLQNANKWSLRQMEKYKEPETPISHHDHMMAEMKWMRKDFRAERKMKKSVCAWLAQRCSDWVAADADGRKSMQVNVRARQEKEAVAQEEIPELDQNGDSAPEDGAPATPKEDSTFLPSLVVAPELSDMVSTLHSEGKLGKALRQLPIIGAGDLAVRLEQSSMVPVSRFINDKVFPVGLALSRKRSRYDYEDDAQILDEDPNNKRLREERSLNPDDEEVALFHPDNKHIRDRLHANNAFRPPSEFVMPSTSFYEFRNGSQWIWEDDQKLRKLAKEYSFNWSLIADEMTLPSRFKTSAERRTPWECFERWVELETLPAEMRKTMYFKTWYQRLEQSQAASERRYQIQVRAIQESAPNAGTPVPIRRRITPSRVEKRKNTRYLWLVDAMRKLARKRETNAYKQAEAQRAAAQRKAQTDTNQQQRGPMLTPQEWSKRRHDRDVHIAEQQRLHRQKMIEAAQQQRQMAIARAAQQGQLGAQGQRPTSGNAQQPGIQMQANSQPVANMGGQVPQQARPGVPVASRTGHLAVPQMNGQAMPQAQMRPGAGLQQQTDMQRLAQVTAQSQQQQYQLQKANPNGNLTAQQQMQNSQALLAQMNAQQQAMGAGQVPNNGQNHAQMAGSPSMPPPPAPHNNAPQKLSSGHVPAFVAIKTQLRAQNPNATVEQIEQAATYQLKSQSTNQARQNAMNAAAGIHNGNAQQQQQYGHNQVAFQNANQMANVSQQALNNASPQTQAAYAAQMRQRQMQMMRMQQSPNGGHASPNLQPASPNMQYAAATGQSNANSGQRPPSRSNTPQMQRVGSSGSNVAAVATPNGMQSPGQQSSPRPMQAANMAR